VLSMELTQQGVTMVIHFYRWKESTFILAKQQKVSTLNPKVLFTIFSVLFVAKHQHRADYSKIYVDSLETFSTLFCTVAVGPGKSGKLTSIHPSPPNLKKFRHF